MMKTELLIEEPAMVLTAGNAVGKDDEVAITWDELRTAALGTEWFAAGGGALFSDEQRAKLVYRDNEVAVLLVVRDYRDDGRHEIERTLKVLAFADAAE